MAAAAAAAWLVAREATKDLITLKIIISGTGKAFYELKASLLLGLSCGFFVASA